MTETFRFKVTAQKFTGYSADGMSTKSPDFLYGTIEVKAENQALAHNKARSRALRLFRNWDRVTVRKIK